MTTIFFRWPKNLKFLISLKHRSTFLLQFSIQKTNGSITSILAISTIHRCVFASRQVMWLFRIHWLAPIHCRRKWNHKRVKGTDNTWRLDQVIQLLNEKQLQFSSRGGYRDSGQTNRAPERRAHLWTRDGGANTPCLGGQLKYRTPPTEPSFLPLGLSSLIPNHKPAQTRTRWKSLNKE